MSQVSSEGSVVPIAGPTSRPPLASGEQIRSIANPKRLSLACCDGAKPMPWSTSPCTFTEAVSKRVGLRVGTEVGPWLGLEVGMEDRKTLNKDLVVSAGGAQCLPAPPLTVWRVHDTCVVEQGQSATQQWQRRGREMVLFYYVFEVC